jgi:flagellar biosynthesis protein FliR
MHAEVTFSIATLSGFLMVLARVSGVIVFVPIPGLSAGPDAGRIVLALTLTIALFPAWPAVTGEGAALSVGRVAGGMTAEAVFGLMIGVAVAFLLEGVQLAAQVLGLQAGYSYASTVDPVTQADSTTLQLMAQLLAGLLFFACGFDRRVLQILAKSLESDPVGRFVLHRPAVESIPRLGSAIFSTGVQLAMPVLALLVLLDIAFAVLGRLHAQLQLLSLSFAIKMLVALAFLASILSFYPDVFARAGAATFNVLARALNQ